MVEPLTPTQLRVVGALAEKEATVPDTYPMTSKGLQTACNQRNSRDPVTDLSEHEIQLALDELKALGLVRFVHASHGARSTKYRHVLHERHDLEPAELGLLAVLALRGPQTVNELRTRTERAHRFADNDEVEATLEALAGRDDPLVVHLHRQPGQKETRWMHLLAGPVDPTPPPLTPTAGGADRDVARGAAGGHAVVAGTGDEPGPASAVDAAEAGLEARVAELETKVAALEALLTDP